MLVLVVRTVSSSALTWLEDIGPVVQTDGNRTYSGLISTLRNFTTPLSFATPLSSFNPKPC